MRWQLLINPSPLVKQEFQGQRLADRINQETIILLAVSNRELGRCWEAGSERGGRVERLCQQAERARSMCLTGLDVCGVRSIQVL